MSNATLPSSSVEKPVAKRTQGACAECRRKRSRCDRAIRQGSQCTNCEISDIVCVAAGSQKTQLQRQQDYIRILETRIKRLEGYIQAIFPEEDVETIITKPPPSLKSRSATKRRAADDLTTSTEPGNFSDISDEEDIGHVALIEQLVQLSVTPLISPVFIGQASPMMAAKQAATLRSQITGEPDNGLDLQHCQRPQFWTISPWEDAYVTSYEATYVYPDPELLMHLVTLYFEKANSIIPILHEPTFMEGLMSGKHHRDASFGMTVLLVCANGSKYSADPRICYAPDSQQPTMSNGWFYFCQVPVHRRSIFHAPTVYDLQYYALAAIYLGGSSLCSASSNVVCIGLRYAIEVGAHRQNGENRPSAEKELSKRAFWALFCLDAIHASFFGRPAGITHESFDVEYPVECDDQYWSHEDPDKGFKQPPEKPCGISSFVCFIKLCEILSFSSRTLYSTKKSRLSSGYFGDDWGMRMVAELDSSLNKWKASLPSHLHWDPVRKDSQLFQQSANLHSMFYYVQIQAHRPFLTKRSELSLTSIAMCTNAARSCSHIQDAAISRDLRVFPQTTYIAFTSGIVSVLCLWSFQASSYGGGDHQKEMDNIHRCINILTRCDKIWVNAGSLCDILTGAASLNQSDTERNTNVVQTQPLSDPFQHIFAPPDDTAWSNDTWDYTRLFLAELGHREPQRAADNHIHAAVPAAEQLSDPSAVNNSYTWVNNNAATSYNRTSFEDWDPYAQNPGHL